MTYQGRSARQARTWRARSAPILGGVAQLPTFGSSIGYARATTLSKHWLVAHDGSSSRQGAHRPRSTPGDGVDAVAADFAVIWTGQRAAM